jgi:hypothetical protein
MAAAVAVAMAGALSSCSKASPSLATPPSQTKPQAYQAKPQAYSTAIAEVTQYLVTWSADGASAAQRLLVPSERGPDPIRLSGGNVVSYRPDRWVSANEFTLLVILDLHFTGSPGAWSSGRNGRFITFTRNGGQHRYLMYFATSP